MFKCSECGTVFNDDAEFDSVTELYGQTFLVCPHCSGVFDEAYQCEECGEWFLEEEMKVTNDLRKLCEECFQEVEEGE